MRLRSGKIGAASLVLGLLAACAATPTQLSPSGDCASSTPAAVDFHHYVYQDWPAVFGPVVCADRRVRFRGDRFEGLSRVELWLVGDSQGFFPGPPSPNEAPTGVKLGESTVDGQGRIDFEACLSRRMPTTAGGMLELAGGRRYGMIVRTQSPTEPMHFSSYHAFELPGSVSCATSAPVSAPHLAVEPSTPCEGDAVIVRGSGFEAGTLAAKLWIRREPPSFGGKEPPTIVEVGNPTIAAGGTFELRFSLSRPAGYAGAQYTLEVYDQGQTRATRLAIPLCTPSPASSPASMN